LKSEIIQLDNIIDLILGKIESFGLKIHNIKILSANYLKKFNIIAQHYGVINSIAANAIHNMSESSKTKFKEIYGISISEVKVLGGLEFLNYYSIFNPISLDYLWQNKKCEKLSGGTYCLDVKLDDEKIYLINGFHPRQLQQYIEKGRSIVTMVLSGNIDWSEARSNFIGSTFPANANKGSIRKELLNLKNRLGLNEVSQALNGVHLSAGPVEALNELCRYNSNYSETNQIKKYSDFSFGKKLLENFNKKKILEILSNINIPVEGKKLSVFDLTEEKNSDEAIELLKKYV
jgi:nucleoside diphosphate kinase